MSISGELPQIDRQRGREEQKEGPSYLEKYILYMPPSSSLFLSRFYLLTTHHVPPHNNINPHNRRRNLGLLNSSPPR